MALFEEKTFPIALLHEGYVREICLDHYGRRAATCSEDGNIKIFRRNASEQGWEFISELPKIHKQGITKISWSHPEFSMLLASCSDDQSFIVWEEEGENNWKPLFYGKEDKAIYDIQFGPKHLDLVLAVSLAGGTIKVFSPSDLLRKEWSPKWSFEVSSDNHKEELDVPSLSWNTFPYDSPSMVVGSVNSKSALIWRTDKDGSNFRNCGVQLSHGAAVNHVAWAPNLGRSFHLIATASSDGTAKIWSVKAETREENKDSILGDGAIVVNLVQTLNHEACEVHRVEWNLTATILATSSDDGKVHLWSPNLKGEWIPQLILDDDNS